jgi:hypothetical protein
MIITSQEFHVTTNEPRCLVFNFGEIRRGDCTITNGVFRFYENGATLWECTIFSADSGDEWWSSFSGGELGYDGNPETLDKFLFAVAFPYHFDIRDANTPKFWRQELTPQYIEYKTGIGPWETFNRLRSIAVTCNC